jgi:hypothetical protein
LLELREPCVHFRHRRRSVLYDAADPYTRKIIIDKGWWTA